MQTPNVLPDLAESLELGHTLPGTWYTDEAIFALEQERIFRRSWLYAGLAAAIPGHGDFFTAPVGPVEVVVVRDEDGAINAFVNVCRHRGARVVTEERGSRKTLQCPYHAWTYGLDGRLKRAPRAERNPTFDPCGLDLYPVRIALCGPLIFVNLDPEAPPFEQLFGNWRVMIEEGGFDFDSVMKPHFRYTTQLACNWKLLVENNLECYHCPANHPGLHLIMDTNEDTWMELHGHFMRYGPKPVAGEIARTAEEGLYRVEEGARETQLSSCLFPNFFCSIMPGDGIATATTVVPLTADSSLYVRQYCFADSVDEQTRADCIAFWDQVVGEDRALVETVQCGLASGFFTQGRLLLPFTEPGINHHQRLVCSALSD